MNDWPTIIKGLMDEHDISEREMARRAGVYRSTLRRFLHGNAGIYVTQLESILKVFGSTLSHEPTGAPHREKFAKKGKRVVRIIPYRCGRLDEEKPPCPSRLPESVAARSSLTGNAAHVRSPQHARAKPASTSSDRPHANAATTASGTKRAPHTSPRTGHA
jgi:transcriptional regulator with XRE-family HTH domain